MFAALSWSWAQGGWVFCWLPLSDSWVMGLLLFAFRLCVCAQMCLHVTLKLLWSLWMLSAPIQTAPLWSDGCFFFFLLFLNFLAQKGPSDLDLVPEEYSVMIGSYPCNISFHNDQLFHCTINGLLGSSERDLPVTVSIHVTARENPFILVRKISLAAPR